MKKIIQGAAGFEVSRVTTADGVEECRIQVTLHMAWEWYEMFEAGASSVGVSMHEYVRECAKDGLARGYR